jgi:hypothetical protein
MAKKKVTNAAAEALERAKKHFERASEDPEDADQLFVWSFYALENAVIAAALHAGIDFQKPIGRRPKPRASLSSSTRSLTSLTCSRT